MTTRSKASDANADKTIDKTSDEIPKSQAKINEELFRFRSEFKEELGDLKSKLDILLSMAQSSQPAKNVTEMEDRSAPILPTPSSSLIKQPGNPQLLKPDYDSYEGEKKNSTKMERNCATGKTRGGSGKRGRGRAKRTHQEMFLGSDDVYTASPHKVPNPAHRAFNRYNNVGASGPASTAAYYQDPNPAYHPFNRYNNVVESGPAYAAAYYQHPTPAHHAFNRHNNVGASGPASAAYHQDPNPAYHAFNRYNNVAGENAVTMEKTKTIDCQNCNHRPRPYLCWDETESYLQKGHNQKSYPDSTCILSSDTAVEDFLTSAFLRITPDEVTSKFKYVW